MLPAGGTKSSVDVVVVGAGLIGLAIALEMRARGARVMVVERGAALEQASVAAAGMLAAEDLSHPPELLEIARRSAAMYPAFLRRLEAVGGVAVPFQTERAVQYANDGGVTRLAERSIDPRQLAAAVMAAVRGTSMALVERVTVESVAGEMVRLSSGDEVVARSVVWAAGAWMGDAIGEGFPVGPRKGQMMRVRLPEGVVLDEVHRNERVYVVPRTAGSQEGTALLGATIEDAGFDTTVHAADLERLRGLAVELVPEMADAGLVEAWAGLRPATPDGLPVLGAWGDGRQFVAGGHYRNGVLLAPATAAAMADLLEGKTPGVDLQAFAVGRFER